MGIAEKLLLAQLLQRPTPIIGGGEIPFVTPAQLGFQPPITTADEYVTSEGADHGRLLPEGAVLVCCIGSLGKTGTAGVPLISYQQINAIIFDPIQVDARYGYHAARSLTPLLEHFAPSTTVKIVKKSAFAEFQIPLPPLAEQKRIAGILDAADALRAKRREALGQLDTLLQSTFLDMFGDPVTNTKGWEVKPLNELLREKSTNGAYYPKDAYSSVGTRMVHMANAFYGVVNPNEVKRVDAPLADIEKYGLLPTDILVSRRSLNYEGSAKPCLIPETDEPLIFESSLIRVRPDRERVLTIYLFHYLLNDRARAKYVFPLVTRSTISGISQSNLMKVKVVLPPLDLQLRFAAVVESIEQQQVSQRAHLAELDTLFASLQSRAFRGDL